MPHKYIILCNHLYRKIFSKKCKIKNMQKYALKNSYFLSAYFIRSFIVQHDQPEKYVYILYLYTN